MMAELTARAGQLRFRSIVRDLEVGSVAARSVGFRDPALETVGHRQKVVKREQAAKVEARLAVQETESENVSVEKSHERAHRQPPRDFLETTLETLHTADRLGYRFMKQTIGQCGLPDGVPIMLFDPDSDRGVSMMFKLALQAQDTPFELDVFMRLVVAGAAPGTVGNFLVAAQVMFEQPQVPTRRIPAVADMAAQEIVT